MTIVTQNEIRVLRAILTNDFNSTSDPTAEVWASDINAAAEPSGIEGKSLSGVCASLTQKGLIKSSGAARDAVIWLTDEGARIAKGG